MKENKQSLWLIEITTKSSCSPVLEEFLSTLGVPFSLVHNREKDLAVSRIYCQSEKEAEHMSDRLDNELNNWRALLPVPRWEVNRRTLARDEWAESWKKNFHPFKASRRLVVKPGWENYQPAPEEIVLPIDPGMCFGTGYHGTTQACLQFLDELEAEYGSNKPFLDAGCGSGILSLAALTLGFDPVYAFDNDPDAVDVTGKHLNNWPERAVQIETAELQDYQPPMKFPLVAANILAPVLINNVDKLISFLDCTRNDSFLILSGILSGQYPEVKHEFEKKGMREISSRTIDNWQSGCFQSENLA